MMWASIGAGGDVLGISESEAQAAAIGVSAVAVSDELAAIVKGGGRIIWDGTALRADEALLSNLHWDALRLKRDALLAACDWTQLPDVSDTVALVWRPYRQALRDLPEVTADPAAPAWPVPPAA